MSKSMRILLLYFILATPSIYSAEHKIKAGTYNDIIETNFHLVDTQAFLEYLSDRISRIDRQIYSHQNPDWAEEISKQYIKHGYSANMKPAIDITKKIHWGEVIDGDGNYTYKLNAMYMAEPFLLSYIKTKNPDHFNIALNIHKDWINQNIHNNIQNKYKWYDMSTGLRTVQLSYIVSELILNKTDPSEVYPLLKALKTHTEILANPNNLGVMNHIMFQMAGIYATCNLVPFFKECDSWLNYADKQFTKSITDQYSTEGIHLEHSPTYHTWGLEKISALLKTGWFPKNIEDLIEKARHNIIWMYHPNGQMLNIGHSEQINQDRYHNFSQYVSYVLTEGSEGNAPPFNFKKFSNSGYGLIRSPWTEKPFKQHSYLFLNAGYHSTSHKTNDDLSFEWSELGSVILFNAGKYAYDKSSRRRYFESSRGNNTIEVKGYRSKITPNNAYGSAINEVLYNLDKKIGFISASYMRRENNVIHERVLSLSQARWLLVQDIIGNASSSPETYIQWFHLNPSSILVEKSKYSVKFFIPEINQYLSIIDLSSSTDVTIKKGFEGDDIQGWYSRKPWEFKPNYAIGFMKHTSKHHFKTIFLLHQSVDTPQLKTYEQIDTKKVCLNIDGKIDGYSLNHKSLKGCYGNPPEN